MNRSKQKGTSFETEVVRYLQSDGFPEARRNALQGNKDIGDIGGLPVVIEVKNCKEMSLAQWVDEAVVEARNAEQAIGVVWHKRRGKGSPAECYVTMRGMDFVLLLQMAADAF